MQAQLNRISDSHQDMWGCDFESVRTEQKCTLVEDHISFEMQEMTVRTDQLLCIAEATGSKMYTWELETETHDRAKTLVLLLKNATPIITSSMRKEQIGPW